MCAIQSTFIYISLTLQNILTKELDLSFSIDWAKSAHLSLDDSNKNINMAAKLVAQCLGLCNQWIKKKYRCQNMALHIQTFLQSTKGTMTRQTNIATIPTCIP